MTYKTETFKSLQKKYPFMDFQYSMERAQKIYKRKKCFREQWKIRLIHCKVSVDIFE